MVDGIGMLTGTECLTNKFGGTGCFRVVYCTFGCPLYRNKLFGLFAQYLRILSYDGRTTADWAQSIVVRQNHKISPLDVTFVTVHAQVALPAKIASGAILVLDVCFNHGRENYQQP